MGRDLHIVFASPHRIVKKSNLSDYSNVRKGGIIAINIEEDDCLNRRCLTSGDNEIVLITTEGMSLLPRGSIARSGPQHCRGLGHPAGEGRSCVVIALVNNEGMLLVAGENGVGKRTAFDEYRTQKRGGKESSLPKKPAMETGRVVGALTVTEKDELMLITTKGQMVRTRISRRFAPSVETRWV
jgi:DNA gyrase subunit A